MTNIHDLLSVLDSLKLAHRAVMTCDRSMDGASEVVQVHVLGVPSSAQFSVQRLITRKCFELLKGGDASWEVHIHGEGQFAAPQYILDSAEASYDPPDDARREFGQSKVRFSWPLIPDMDNSWVFGVDISGVHAGTSPGCDWISQWSSTDTVAWPDGYEAVEWKSEIDPLFDVLATLENAIAMDRQRVVDFDNMVVLAA